MSDYNLESDDPTFVDDFFDARRAVEKSALWLRAKKHVGVFFPPEFLRSSADMRGEFSDDFDLLACMPIEIKHRKTVAFTCAEDFPYQWLFIEKVQVLKRKKRAPWAYQIWNKDLTAFVWLDVIATRERWVEDSLFLSGRDQPFYKIDPADPALAYIYTGKDII